MSDEKSTYLDRVMKYCAAAERCSHDVVTKLISWGINLEEAEIILTKLRKEKFLDDKRYTQSYVSEKWNLDLWGRIKIQNALQQKQVDEMIIADAIASIDEQDYLQKLHSMMRDKLREVKSGNSKDDARRVFMYATSKGFEEELVGDWINDNISPEET